IQLVGGMAEPGARPDRGCSQAVVWLTRARNARPDSRTLDENVAGGDMVPKVSVIMAVYNGERFVREAIDSILTQTFGDFELIVVDDGSTDGTPQILAGYGDPRLRMLRNASNIGQA